MLAKQLIDLEKAPDQPDLTRAKNQLKTSLMMNLETRPARFEDMMEMVMGRGHRKPPADFLREIDEVTPARLQVSLPALR